MSGGVWLHARATLQDSRGHDERHVRRDHEPEVLNLTAADGIVNEIWEPNVVIGLDDVIAATDAMRTIGGGQRRPLLMDMFAIGALDRPGRMEFGRHDDLVSAIALIGNTPLNRMTINFWLRVAKLKIPTRMFEDEATAVAWLSDFVL